MRLSQGHREFPVWNSRESTIPRIPAGITEFSAGIAGNLKKFKNLVNFVPYSESLSHENSFSSSFEFKSSRDKTTLKQ